MYYLKVFCSIWRGGACVIKSMNGMINYITAQDKTKISIFTTEPESAPVETDIVMHPSKNGVTTRDAAVLALIDVLAEKKGEKNNESSVVEIDEEIKNMIAAEDVLLINELTEEIDHLNEWVKITTPPYNKIKKEVLTTVEGVVQRNRLAIKERKEKSAMYRKDYENLNDKRIDRYGVMSELAILRDEQNQLKQSKCIQQLKEVSVKPEGFLQYSNNKVGYCDSSENKKNEGDKRELNDIEEKRKNELKALRETVQEASSVAEVDEQVEKWVEQVERENDKQRYVAQYGEKQARRIDNPLVNAAEAKSVQYGPLTEEKIYMKDITNGIHKFFKQRLNRNQRHRVYDKVKKMKPQHDEEHQKLEKVVGRIVDNLKPILENMQKNMQDTIQVMHSIRGHISGNEKMCQMFNARFLVAM